ncbi:hypothetical protein [Kocuria sp. cx-455]|uniref:hypothetical protein n=1 Tax=Kocuria sp. cx-455 TaxID=2771377 RepID=UPI003D753525
MHEVNHASSAYADDATPRIPATPVSLVEYSWAVTKDRSARTAPGRAAFKKKFYDAVDPDRVLDPVERERRAETARTEFYRNIGAKGAAARRAKRGAAA